MDRGEKQGTGDRDRGEKEEGQRTGTRDRGEKEEGIGREVRGVPSSPLSLAPLARPGWPAGRRSSGSKSRSEKR